MTISTNDAGATGHHKQKMNLNLSLTSYTKINSKQIMDLNIKCKIIKHLGKKNRGEKVQALELGKEFLDLISKAKSMKGKIYKLDFIKILNSCSVEETLLRG